MDVTESCLGGYGIEETMEPWVSAELAIGAGDLIVVNQSDRFERHHSHHQSISFHFDSLRLSLKSELM